MFGRKDKKKTPNGTLFVLLNVGIYASEEKL